MVLGLPTKQWWDGKERVAALRAETSALEAEVVARQERLDAVLGAAETERLARSRLGMVRAGERAFIVPAPETELDLPRVDDPTAATPDPWWKRAFGSVGRAIRALI